MEKNNHGLKWRVLQKPPLAHCLETGVTNCLQLSIHHDHFSFIFQQLRHLTSCTEELRIIAIIINIIIIANCVILATIVLDTVKDKKENDNFICIALFKTQRYKVLHS